MTTDVTNTLQRLKLFKNRIESIRFPSGRGLCDGCQDDDDDRTLLSQLIKELQNLIHFENQTDDFLPDHLKQILRRLNRTLDGLHDQINRYYYHSDQEKLDSFLTDPWKLCQEDLESLSYWLQTEDFPDGDSVLLERFDRVKKFEDDLNRRQQQQGQLKTLRELCKEHSLFLTKYLEKCICLHSNIPVRGLKVENVNHLLKQPIRYEKERSSSCDGLSEDIEVPLQLLSLTLSEILPNNDEHRLFIPSQQNFIHDEIDFMRESFDSKFIFETYRWSLILGGPGCGKTTLLRSIMLQCARSLFREYRLVIYPKDLDKWKRLSVHFHRKKHTSRGPIRVPILIQIGELVSLFHTHLSWTIMDYIKYKESVDRKDNSNISILCQLIDNGHCLLLFDGLDEVSNYDERQKIVYLIDAFIEEHVRTPEMISVNDEENLVNEWGGLNCQCPRLVGANQIIITSRAIGYFLFPLKAKMVTLLKLNLMDESTSQTFVTDWLLHVRYDIVHRCRNSPVLDIEKIKATEESLRKSLYSAGERFWSHPMLLSLALPLLYKTTRDETENKFTLRITLYEATIKFALESLSVSYETGFTNEAIEWILRDMAVYLHRHCPSGLMDTFDLSRLTLIALREFYKQKSMRISSHLMKMQSEEFLRIVTTNVGFVAARGLDAYGFAHRIFQEYYVGLTIIKCQNTKHCVECCSPGAIANRLFLYTMEVGFYEVLILTMDWISCTLQPDDFAAFCIELSKKFIGPVPMGALFLVNVLEELSNMPSSSVLKQICAQLIFSSTMDESLFLDYLRNGLSTVKNGIDHLIKELLHQTIDRFESLCRFLVLSLWKMKGESFGLPNWMSKTILEKLESMNNQSENVETMIDSTFRNIVLDSTNIDINLSLMNFPLEQKFDSFSFHPVVLSVLIALCGGLTHAKYDLMASKFFSSIKKPRFLTVDLTQIHRSTPLFSILFEYLTDKTSDMSSVERLHRLIEKCLKIVRAASPNDISRQTVDAFVALLCLQGLNKPAIYEPWLVYRALPRALYRLRLAFYHMRQLYSDRHQNSLRPPNTLSIYAEDAKKFACQILENNFETVSNGRTPREIASLILAVRAALSHLFSPSLSSNVTLCDTSPVSVFLAADEKFRRSILACSADVLYAILDLSSSSGDDTVKWDRNQHPYQLYRKLPLFLVAFISEKCRPLFERLILSKRIVRRNKITKIRKGTLPFFILLAEVLLHIDQTLMSRYSDEKESQRHLLLLRTLNSDIIRCQLENYAQIIVHKIKEKNNNSRSHWFLRDRDDTVNIQRQPIYRKINDFERFTVSIEIVRTLELTRKKHELFEEAIQTGKAIEDSLLKVLCFRHLREITRSWIDSMYFYRTQQEVLSALEQLPTDLPLLLSAYVFRTCVEEKEQINLIFRRLSTSIWTSLECKPNNDEDRRDQEVVLKVLQDTFYTDEQTRISHSFLALSNLSDIFQMNSPALNIFFQTNRISDASANILFTQLYLTEVTVDAQRLTRFIEHRVSNSSSVGQMIKNLDQNHYGVFTHRRVILIDNLIEQSVSSNNERIEIPFDKLLGCVDFEDRDRPRIESWLKYCHDEHCCQFAAFATFLLIRSQKQMSPVVSSMVEFIINKGLNSRIDHFRRGIRACFKVHSEIKWYACYLPWNPSMWQILTKLWINSMNRYFTRFVITTVDEMNRVLQIERHRLISSMKEIDAYSYLMIIEEYRGNDVRSHVESIVNELVDSTHDEYLAAVLLYVVKTFEDDQTSDILLGKLKTLLYNPSLPNAQRAAVFTLATKRKGRAILDEALGAHFDLYDCVPIEQRKLLSEQILVACLLALALSREDNMTQQPIHFSQISCCFHLCDTLSKSVTVRQHALACYISWERHEKNEDQNLLNILGVTLQDIYAAYLINTSSYLIEERTQERDRWIEKTVELICLYSQELLGQFIDDLYTYSVTASNKFEIYPQSNLLAVAQRFISQDRDMFLRGIRASHSCNETSFKKQLYLLSKRGTVEQREICIELYASFGELTSHFLDMMFSACLEDFSSLAYTTNYHYRGLRTTDRTVVECIFPYLESLSIKQRRLASRWLIELVHLDILSSTEVQQLILNDPTYLKSNDNVVDFCRLSCLKRLPNRDIFPLVHPNQVDFNFLETLETSLLTLCLN